MPDLRRDNACGQSARKVSRQVGKASENSLLTGKVFPLDQGRLRVVVDNAKDVSASLVRTDETMSNARPGKGIHEKSFPRREGPKPGPG